MQSVSYNFLTSISIPSEIVLYQDDEFLEDIERVDELYFSKLVAPKSNVRDRQFCDLSSDSETDTSDFGDVNYDSDSESDNDNYDGDVYIPNEVNDTDTKEYIIRSKFQNDTCGCKEFYGMPCSTKIACEFRDHCLQCTREELDTILKVEMFAHRRSGSVTQSKKHREKERERPFQEYYFNGCRVCRTTFCFVHAVERKKLHKVARSLDTEGFLPRTHGNSGKAPHNSLSVTDRDRIKTFITKYASDHALPLPGRLPNYKSEKVLLLPSDTTTADIHAKYEILAEEMNFRRIHLRTFQRTWHELCPFITIMNPCTDLCQLCQNFSHQLSTVSNMNDEEKEEILSTYTQHVSQAKQQRDYYRHQYTTSKEVFISLSEECKQTGNAPCSVDVEMHYSWDYAQQVHFPHHAQQVGPIFFKTPRKCNVFGVCCEGSGKQVFYLIDEAENTGKGANSVISMVQHFFQYHGYGEKTAAIHFDNCSGQNKNNFVLWYALWRVLVGLHVIVEYSMMVAGHTKFDPDWHFGVWKVKWRSSTAETMNEIADTVRHSSRRGHNIPQLVSDPQTPVQFRDWKSYFEQFFKPLKNIRGYHHFRVSAETPGVVECKELCNSVPLCVNLLKDQNILPSVSDPLPQEIPAPGLDPKRQWYLYEEIREHCLSLSSKDTSCPKPVVPKKEVKVYSRHHSSTSHLGKRKSLLLR
ncbi:uncharacterized protein LOC134272593 [Saccostrea cucullata]|uniref:uncharacterized protein LOC134272593 n=1 Tax=Saccostrea cuccullata TaxID=36930 RepID=UPI002ED150AF